MLTEKSLEQTAGCGAQADRLARIIWARVTEPADPLLGAVLEVLGAVGALDWLNSVTHSAPGGADLPAELRNLDLPTRNRVLKSLNRWQPRLADVNLDREMRALAAFDGSVLTPQDSAWPLALNDLGHACPACLWIRGDISLATSLERSVAVVGARASTSYGEEVTAQFVTELCEREFTIVSGGAYGIDITAHRAALAVDGLTVSILAGGADRLYPRGNAHVLEQVANSGLIVSEHPPGSAPTRARFLTRNRLIAALARGTVVVEAALRSGALSTARHAVKLGRPLGAVPGPVTSMMSGGCHNLIREEGAVCVTDPAEVAELVGTIGRDLAPEKKAEEQTLFDTLNDDEAAIAEALPLRQAVSLESVARTAARSLDQTMATLAKLEMRDIACRDGSLWKRKI